MMLKDMLKYYYFRAHKVVCGVIRVLPLKNNRIVCMSHRGASQYSDSPMYITEYLLANYPGRFEIIWEVSDLDKFAYLNEKGIKTVKFGSLKDYYYLNTAKVSITNAGFPSFLLKRNNQLRINTWHGGGGYKSGAVFGRKKDTVGTKYARKLKEYIRNQYNLMPSSCESQSRVRREGSARYKGEILSCGLPRNDIMFRDNPDIVAKVRKYFSIGEDTNILLVAPTWKSDNDDRNIRMDYGEICRIMEEKTGKPWVVLLRLHHLSTIDISGIIDAADGRVMNATDYPDVQELLYTADMLISDYSSVIWDFALTGKPIALFTPDINDYDKMRGFSRPVSEWGLAYAQTNGELLDLLKKVSMQELREHTKEHLKIYNSYETGTATKTIVDRIVEFCKT